MSAADDAPGARHVLTAGPYRAEIAEQGAALHALTHNGRALTLTTDDVVPLPPFRGAVLVPWPNRLADGRYFFEGVEHQVPITEVARGNALHGLALWDAWTPTEVTPTRVVLTHPLLPRPGYPFSLRVRTEYDLDAEAGLRITVQAENVGPGPAPYGTSIHPYFVADDGILDDWTLHLPAGRVITVDDRLLPTGDQAVAEAELDFQTPVPIGSREIDHAFAGVAFAEAGSDNPGTATATLTGPTGQGIRLDWDANCPWVQVYTLVGFGLHRRAVAIEPMTCAPDAFNSGAGLIVLAPGEQHRVAWTISAITAR